MPRLIVQPQDQRAEYTPGSSCTFQLAGNPGEWLLPGAALCGYVYLTGTGAAGTKYLPTTGVHACVQSVYVSSAEKGGLVNIMNYPRYAAVALAGVRPEDRFSASGDLSTPSLAVSRGIFSGATSADTALPFCLSLEQLRGGLLAQPLPFSATGTITIQIQFSTAANACIQDAGNTDASFTITGLALSYNVSNGVRDSGSARQPITFMRPEVQQINVDSSRFNLVIPPTETLVAAAIVFMDSASQGSLTASSGAMQAPPGLTSVKFSMDSSALEQFELLVADPYADTTQAGFYSALVAAGFPLNTSGAMAPDSVAARPGAGRILWRAANTDATGGAGGSLPLALAGVAVEDAWGLGAVFPPAGAQGQFSVELNWAGGTTYVAHLVMVFLRAA